MNFYKKYRYFCIFLNEIMYICVIDKFIWDFLPFSDFVDLFFDTEDLEHGEFGSVFGHYSSFGDFELNSDSYLLTVFVFTGSEQCEFNCFCCS